MEEEEFTFPLFWILRTRSQLEDAVVDRQKEKTADEFGTWDHNKLLGRGAFGQVFLETCVEGSCVGKARAFKMFSDRDFRSRELYAASVLSSGDTDGIIPKFLGWSYDGVPYGNYYMFMEYLPLGSLELHFTDDHRPSRQTVQELARAMLAALEKFHSFRFAHRDLKPGVSIYLPSHLALFFVRKSIH